MGQKNTNNLLASIAVFAELCDSEKDIKGILREFIKSIFALENVYSVDSYEAATLLKKHFEFEIPEAVVKVCLSSLVKSGFVERGGGKFILTDTSYNVEMFSAKISAKKDDQQIIENDLIKYYEGITGERLDAEAVSAMLDSFISYLIDSTVIDKFSSTISSFILSHSDNEDFILELNQIKEGLVLIQGLKFTNDLTNLGKWTDEITIYIDTEHLFNCNGYNGEVFKRLFHDFYELVREINATYINKGQKKLIHLKYFEEVEKEVHDFFHVAEKIIRREANLSPHSIAMQEICNGCKSPSDVLRKKADFFSAIKGYGIQAQETKDYYLKHEYIIEDALLVEKYSSRYSISDIEKALKYFTKVNYFRRGVNRAQFEKIGYIFLTGNNLTLQLSKDLDVKSEAKDIPFATDIYFVTNRFWYKLNKGFSKSLRLPSTLDIVTKAQIVLSSQVSKSIEERYSKLKHQVSTGLISEEQAQEYYYTLREKAKKPEDITTETLVESIEVIFDDDMDHFFRNRTLLLEKVKQGEDAIKKLKEFQIAKSRKRKGRAKCLATCIIYMMMSLAVILLSGALFLLFYMIYIFNSPQDSKVAIYGTIVGILSVILTIIAMVRWKKLKYYFGRKRSILYLAFIR